MKKIELFKNLSEFFEYKIIKDEFQNEYVILQSNPLDVIDKIEDKTAFEATQNHIHLMDNIKKVDYNELILIAERLGKVVLNNLNSNFPNKHFIVFISIKLYDSLIIRFHQKWEKEVPYLNPSDFVNSGEKILSFE